MKKLMITLSAAALATSVFADEGTPTMYQTTEGFETYEAETVIKTATPTEAEGTTMLWYSAGADGETGTVKAYGETDGKLNGAGNNYLNVETTTGTPLYRKLAAHNAGELVNQDSDRVDIGDGIYVDTYVQFTASEEAPAEIADSKLVVWVKETVDEEAGTSTKDLMVMAGQLNASGVPVAQNFVIDTTGMDLTGWHRLTIRAMVAREADQASIAAFTLFLDGVQLTAKATQVPGKDAVYEEDGETIKEEAVAGVDYEDLMGDYPVANLSAEAQEFYKNKQLFYSLVGTDQSGIVKQISAVGFDGSGQIDNVTTTTTAPGFARGYFTISWDNGLSKVEILNGETQVAVFENLEGAGKGVFAIGEDMEQVTVKCTKANSEYTIVGANENGEITLNVEDKVYNIAVESTLVMIGDASYSSLAAALEAAESGATLTLVKSITDLSEMTIEKDITIDLNGNNLVYTPTEGEENPFLFFVKSDASLKIIDSVGNGSVMCTEGYEVELLISVESGSFTLGGLNGDKGATIIGGIGATEGLLSFVRGTIVDMLGVLEGNIESYLYVDELGNKSEATYDEETQTYVIAPSAGGEEQDPDTEIEVGSESVEYTEEQDAIDAAEKIETITVPEEDKGTVDSGWFKAAVVKKEKEGGSFVWVVKPILDKDAAGVKTDVVPTVEAAVKEILGSADNDIFKADDNGDITINLTGLVQGLTYGVEVVTDLKNLGTGEPIWGGKVGDAKTTAIKVKKPAGGKAFFKIHVDYK